MAALSPSECQVNAILGNLTHCAGTMILPGVRQRIYYIHHSDIVTWPKLPATGENMGALSTYTGSFTLAADKKWKHIDLTHNKGELESTTTGELPARLILNKFTIKHPKFDEAAAGLCRQITNDSCVFLIQQRDGKWRVLGSEAFRTDCKPGGRTGEGMSGEFGLNIEIEAADVCPAPFYTGDILTDAGTLNAGTGVMS